MADRERSARERPDPGPHPPTSTSTFASGLAFLPNLFGRRSSTKTAAAQFDARKAAASSSVTRESFDEGRLLLSPLGATSTLPLPSTPNASIAALPSTFNIEQALKQMDQHAESSNVPELIETVKSTSAWLAQGIYETSSGSSTSPPPLKVLGLSPTDVQGLYAHAMEYGSPTSSYPLRTAAVRLLALLVAVAPPRESLLDEDPVGLPLTITRRSIYRLVATWSGGRPGPAYNEQMFVEVGALKALTRNGEIVEGMDGIIGWLLKLLHALKTDWIEWCAHGSDAAHGETGRDTPSSSILSANPDVTAADIISLIAAIVQHHIPLFSPADLTSIVHPMVDFMWNGILVLHDSTPAGAGSLSHEGSLRHTSLGSLGRASHPGSSVNSPAPSARLLEQRRGSLMPGRVEAFPPAAMSRLESSPSRPKKSQVRWALPFRCLCQFMLLLFEMTTVNDDLFDDIFELLCVTLGQDDNDVLMEAADSSFRSTDLLQVMLGVKSGRRGDLALRKALEGRLVVSRVEGRRSTETDRKVARGAVIIARLCTQDNDFLAGQGLSFSALAPSLVDAESTSRYPGTSRFGDWSRWHSVDAEILSLLDARLSFIETSTNSNGRVTGASLDDAWIEGQAACHILDGLLPLIHGISPDSARTVLRSSDSSLVTTFGSILLRLPTVMGRLQSLSHGDLPDSTSSTNSPATPQFYHPKHIELLLDLGSYLDEQTAGLVVDYYQRECLCLPFTSGWLKNIWRLLEAFCLNNDLPVIRTRVLTLLYHDIYHYVEDLAESRAQLVDQVIVPYLDRWLMEEVDDGLVTEALDVLVSAAVAETQQKDEERRRHLATLSEAERDAIECSTLPCEEDEQLAASGSFDAIRAILSKVATEAPCRDEATRLAKDLSIASAPHTPLNTDRDGASVREGRSREQTGLRSLIRTLSPSREPTAVPPVSMPNMTAVLQDAAAANGEYFPTLVPNSTPQHMTCKSLRSTQAIVALFVRLVWGPAQPVDNKVAIPRPKRSITTMRCISVYRDSMNLLFPMADGSAAHAGLSKIPARCPRARLSILQGNMRLRADRKHRLLYRDDINRFVMPFAATLYRTKESEESIRASMEQEEARRRARARPARDFSGAEDDRGRSQLSGDAAAGRNRSRSVSKAPGSLHLTTNNPNHDPRRMGRGRGDDDRGRSGRAGDTNAQGRSRSGSRSRVGPGRGAAEPQPYAPLWCLPETVAFEVPFENHPSDVLRTYDVSHPGNAKGDIEGVWLPVSEYLRVLNGLLRWEHDWDLVSYVLCFLPQQLGNKHYFQGHRATREIKALLQILCDGILEKDNRWERRFHTPPFIKRTHLNAAAYQAISILISYRANFDRHECDRLLESLVAGLEGHTLLAKPSLQALTICIYELESYVTKHMVTILRKMQQILSIPATSIHILEFLTALSGSNIYRNFTDDQYRLVFAISIGYISEHNARSEQPVDFSGSRETYTLSQHVIGLAYQAIYLWFLTLPVRQRPNYVTELVRGLIHAKSQRTEIDERNEVCFDWLARYAYGNADPRPSESFISEIVMRDNVEGQPPKTMSWFLGGAVVTVTAHQRTGWFTISTTRTTGQTSMVCKLENIPLLGLGEDGPDLASLPAFLMANREIRHDVNDEGATGTGTTQPPEAAGNSEAKQDEKNDTGAKVPVDPKAIVSVKPAQTAPDPDSTLPAGHIWVGVAPSQRRKDVQIEPSYVALQMLSSYPNENLKIPRGRLIPKEPKFERALRGIDAIPVINTCKIAVLYVGPDQQNETEILGNTDGSPLYLDFLAHLGRIIRLKGQVDVFTGGLDRENDTDGKYAYAWWDDLSQIVFHTPTLMPNLPHFPEFTNKKRLVGNDYVKIVYNESGKDFAFDTIKTSFNFVNIVISPYATRDEGDPIPQKPEAATKPDDYVVETEDYFKIIMQRAPGIPDFSPIGEYKLVSRRTLPTLVRQIALYANTIAMRYQHIQTAPDLATAEFITLWRARYRAIKRLKDMLPPVAPESESADQQNEMLRDFTRTFSYPETK